MHSETNLKETKEPGELQNCSYEWSNSTNTLTPPITSANFNELIQSKQQVLELFEWIGMVEMGSER